jgi:hypothetical protein
MIAEGGLIANGGSGGPSNCAVNTQGVLGSCTQGYAKPSWQSGAGVPNDNLRDLPDVSLFASYGFLGSFYVICQQDQTGGCSLDDLLGYGGTSVASLLPELCLWLTRKPAFHKGFRDSRCTNW